MTKLKSSNNPLAETKKDYQRPSHELIYESIMRSGGTPFGAPFDVGTSTLTQKIVRVFKQIGFFGFETFDRIKKRNKFTRYGASRYKGAIQPKNTNPKR